MLLYRIKKFIINQRFSVLFKDKTVLVTGASSGFGRAIAHSFAKEGARIIQVARRYEKLREIEKELKSKYNSEVISIELDVSQASQVKEKLKGIETPDILINNAGLVKGLNKAWETPSEDVDTMIDTNVKGILNLCREITPLMLAKKRGDIINIGSVSSFDTYPGGSVYCATKYAVKAITDTLRKELVATPLRVSMIAPGLAETEFSIVRFAGDKEKAKSVYADIDALTAQDIADITLFIASRAPHVNISDVIVFPTNQASVSLTHREPKKA